MDLPQKNANTWKSDNSEDEFLSTRILFLMTYEAHLVFISLFQSMDLAQSLNRVLTSLHQLCAVIDLPLRISLAIWLATQIFHRTRFKLQ